ncbi:hypothetical protein DPMN_160067 [Dreissena polymorpha]|uniref:Uncharacterized protein n=1 Tax=Dreissena polymorpha TaxID=45954 RepID=A0A9D4ELM6_DREPO|nr:hypothetical protein DPMN_160067 [Dreissena polymorpha]
MVAMLDRFALANTSMSGVVTCYLIPSLFLVETGYMKMVMFPGMASIYCPCNRCTEKRREQHFTINFQLGLSSDASSRHSGTAC